MAGHTALSAIGIWELLILGACFLMFAAGVAAAVIVAVTMVRKSRRPAEPPLPPDQPLTRTMDEGE